MKSREDVIKGLEHCVEKLDTVVNKNHGFNCIECPYIKKCEHVGSLIGLPLMRDALALLKAQVANSACTKERCPVNASAISDDCNIETCPWRTEALIPRPSMSGLWYECPACGRHLTKDLDNYCARCGRRVKWG